MVTDEHYIEENESSQLDHIYEESIFIESVESTSESFLLASIDSVKSFFWKTSTERIDYSRQQSRTSTYRAYIL